MSSDFFRVDDRLIHGQVVEGWANFLHATRIVVIDDRVANDPLQKSIMEIAVPSDIRVQTSTVEDSKNVFRDSSKEKGNTIILFSNLEDVLKTVMLGLKMDKLNLGGLRFEKGKKPVSKTIFLDKHDCEILQKLLQIGVNISIQAVPSESPKDIQTILDKYFKI